MKIFNGIDFYLQTFVLFVGFIITILMLSTSSGGPETASIGVIIYAGPIQLGSTIVMMWGRAPNSTLRRIHLLSCLLYLSFLCIVAIFGYRKLDIVGRTLVPDLLFYVPGILVIFYYYITFKTFRSYFVIPAIAK